MTIESTAFSDARSEKSLLSEMTGWYQVVPEQFRMTARPH